MPLPFDRMLNRRRVGWGNGCFDGVNLPGEVPLAFVLELSGIVGEMNDNIKMPIGTHH